MQRVIAGCCLCSLLAIAGLQVTATFNSGSEGWQAYDYNGGIAGGGNVFIPLKWEPKGGVGNSGYVWADDSMWRIDTPEQPNSILAFIFYRSWLKQPEVDLRSAKLRVHLRGDGLDLKGAKCYFWALDNQLGTRWHYIGSPLAVAQGNWDKPLRLVLRNDEKLWHRTWARKPESPASLDQVLGGCDSYGFSFLGFSSEVTGKFSLDELEIRRE